MKRLTDLDLTVSRSAATKLVVVPFADSTSVVLAEHEADEFEWPDLSVVVTDDQRAGRGRHGRTWSTPAGSGLAISILVRDIAALGDDLTWLPLVAGTATREAIAAQLPTHDVSVKWPNDVLVDDRKICGVLVQQTGGSAIVGIGVNTAMAEFPVPTATSFAAVGAHCDIDAFLGALISNLRELVMHLREQRSDVAIAHVTQALGTIGATVRAHLPSGDEIVGVARALGTNGALVIENEAGEHALTAADIVHLRRA